MRVVVKGGLVWWMMRFGKRGYTRGVREGRAEGTSCAGKMAWVG